VSRREKGEMESVSVKEGDGSGRENDGLLHKYDHTQINGSSNAPSYLSFDLTVVASTSLAKSTQIICRMGERRFSASMHKY